MPKLSYAEIFSSDEIWVRTLQQLQKCINFLKIVNCKEHKFQIFVKILKCLNKFKMYNNYQISSYVVLQTFLVERACTVVHYQHK